MRRRIHLRTAFTLDTLDVGPHVEDKHVTLADFKGQWLKPAMDEYRDDADLVKAATREDMDFIAKLNALSSTTVQEAQHEGRRPLGCWLVSIDEGDAHRPEVRWT